MQRLNLKRLQLRYRYLPFIYFLLRFIHSLLQAKKYFFHHCSLSLASTSNIDLKQISFHSTWGAR